MKCRTCRFRPMNAHYCVLWNDCFRCPIPFCPYEKLDDGTESGWETEEETEEEYGDWI